MNLTSRKLTISIGLFVLILLSITVSLKADEVKRSKINFLIHSGFSTIPYIGDSSPGFYKLAANIGLGLNYRLSKNMSLTLNFAHYLFVPKEKYTWYMWIGDTRFKLDEPFYIGDFTYEFNDFLLSFKIKHLRLGNRLNFYSFAGAGASYRREATHWSIGIYGRKIYYTLSVYILVSAGLGVEYVLSKNLDIFLEGGYNYCFLNFKEKNTGVIPYKIGLAWKF